MNTGKTLFAQIMEFIPWTSFARIVARYGGDSGVRSLSCPEQFRAMAFAQLTYRESLRDIETCLLANQAKLYSMGFRSPVRRSTLADANEGRDWHIWADLAALLIKRDRLVRRAISLIGRFSRKYIRLIFAFMTMVITSRLLPLKKQAAYSDYLVNFQRAQPSKSGQFSVRGNRR